MVEQLGELISSNFAKGSANSNKFAEACLFPKKCLLGILPVFVQKVVWNINICANTVSGNRPLPAS